MRARWLPALVAMAGLGVPALAGAVIVWAGQATPGYDPARWSISRLAEVGAPHALAVELSLALLGVTLVGVGLAARAEAVPAWGALLLAGVGVLLIVVVRRDPSRAPVVAMHRVLTLLTFTCLAASPLLTWLRLRSLTDRHLLARRAAIVALLTLAVAAAALPVSLSHLPLLGLVERLLAALGLGWVMLLSLWLARRRGVSPPGATARAAGQASMAEPRL